MPDKIKIEDRVYQAVVFMVHTRTPNGTPQLVKLIHDTQTVELAGGEEFVIGYMPIEEIKD